MMTAMFLIADGLNANVIEATTWYVATTGSNSNTCAQAQSPNTPKRTIAAALRCVGPAGTEAGAGHTVQVASGTYTENLLDQIPSGSSWNAPFTLKSATQYGAVFRPTTDVIHIMFNVPSHYIIIDGFTFDGSGQPEGQGIGTSSATQGDFHHIRITNSEFKNIRCDSIVSSGATFMEITGNLIHDGGDSTSGVGSVGYCHGIYASSLSSNWLVEYNQVYNYQGYGIHFYGPNQQDNTVRYNITHHNGLISGQSGMIVGGIGAKVYNNLSYSNGDSGITLKYSSCQNSFIYNNTTYANGAYGILDVGCSGNTYKNNIALANPNDQIAFIKSSGQVSSNNITTGTASSIFVNATNANFNLRAGSPATNGGTCSIATGIRLVGGSSCYVGAYPYTGSAGSPPAAPSNLIVQP